MVRLTSLGVKNAKPGRHADGAGLYLLVKPSGSRSWLLRVQVDGRRRDIGLGGLSDLTLSEAREKASGLRKVARTGNDPIAERDKDRRGVPSFKSAATSCHSELKAGWTAKSAAAFLSSLKDHAFGRMGSVRVDQVEAFHIRDTLAPIWLAKPEQARKVRQRVGMVLNFAKSKGWRSAEVPGRSVTLGLPKQGAGGNFAAMSYKDVPEFVADLARKKETVGRLALLFAIYTAARSGEVRSARWRPIDVKRKLWSRPAELMKAKVAHTVTLSDQALRLLETISELRTSDDPEAFVFPSSRASSLSDMTLSKIMRDAGLKYTVHGFRSSFRDWAAEQMRPSPTLSLRAPSPTLFQIRLSGRTSVRSSLRCAVPLIPAFAMATIVHKASSSSFLQAPDGSQISGLRGQHLFVLVRDARLIPELVDRIVDRLWLAGYGRYDVSASGSLMERTLFDVSVWQPERLIFTRAACLDGVSQQLPEPKVFPGSLDDLFGEEFPLNEDYLPPLTQEEEQCLAERKARAKERAATAGLMASSMRIAWVSIASTSKPSATVQQIAYSDPKFRVLSAASSAWARPKAFLSPHRALALAHKRMSSR